MRSRTPATPTTALRWRPHRLPAAGLALRGTWSAAAAAATGRQRLGHAAGQLRWGCGLTRASQAAVLPLIWEGSTHANRLVQAGWFFDDRETLPRETLSEGDGAGWSSCLGSTTCARRAGQTLWHSSCCCRLRLRMWPTWRQLPCWGKAGGAAAAAVAPAGSTPARCRCCCAAAAHVRLRRCHAILQLPQPSCLLQEPRADPARQRRPSALSRRDDFMEASDSDEELRVGQSSGSGARR